MTPMKRYTMNLSTMRENLSYLVNVVTLNKSEPKYVPYPYQYSDKSGYTKGVQNDFILIFKSKTNDQMSFALIFDYINKAPEHQTVTGSIKYGKNNEETKTGAPMSLEKFRETINKFNNEIKNSKKLDFDGVMKKFSEVFMNESFDLKETVKQASLSVSQFLQNKKNELKVDELENLTNDSVSIRDQAIQKVERRLRATDIYKEHKELVARVKELEAQIAEKRTALEIEEKVKEKTKLAKDSENVLDKARRQVEKSLDEELNKYPTAVKVKIKNKM